MKKKNYLLLILMLVSFNCFSQQVFEYSYDAKGNRISRLLVSPPIQNPNQSSIEKDTNAIFSFIAYPNPISDVLTIENDNLDSMSYNIQIIDITGKLILETRSNSGKTTLNTSELRNGVYIVVIYYEGKRNEWKIIKN